MTPDLLRPSRSRVTRFWGSHGLIMIIDPTVTLAEMEALTWWMATEMIEVVAKGRLLGRLPELQQLVKQN